MCTRKDYSHIINGFRKELQVNSSTSLLGYCRSVGVSISAVHHWMEKKGLPKRKEKLLTEETKEETKIPTDLFEGQGV